PIISKSYCIRLGYMIYLLRSVLPCPAQTSTLFPYTTLFRSIDADDDALLGFHHALEAVGAFLDLPLDEAPLDGLDRAAHGLDARSEEHTSELQSRENLVCRLLLEKKKEERYGTRTAGSHSPD